MFKILGTVLGFLGAAVVIPIIWLMFFADWAGSSGASAGLLGNFFEIVGPFRAYLLFCILGGISGWFVGNNIDKAANMADEAIKAKQVPLG